MRAVLDVLMLALNLYTYVIIASAILSWLLAFDIVNPRNPVVNTIGNAIWQMTEPLLRPIRRVLPTMGGLDLSPIVLLLGVYLAQRLIIYYLYPLAF